MDETFFSWRGENPITKGSIGYWTLKGWLRIPQSDLERARLRTYAIQVFHDFEMQLKQKKKKEIKKEILEKLKEKNFGLPNHLYKGRKFSFDLNDKLSPEDMKDLSNAIKDTFQTKGYNRSKIRQIAENSVSTYTNHLLVAAPKLLGKLFESKGEGVDYTRKDNLKSDDDTEIKEEAENTILSYAESYGVGLLGAKGGLYALSSATLKISTGLIASESLPVEAGLVVGALVATSLIKKAIFSNRLGGLLHKEKFDQLVSDIYTGSQTPEDLEKKYRKKVDALMKEHDGDDLRVKLQEVYLEFQTEVLPRIEKGLYQRGENEGSVFEDRFRRASEEKNQLPVVLSMRFALAGFDLEENIKNYFDSEKSAKDLQDLLSGKEPVPPSVERFLQKGKVRGFLRDEVSFQKKKEKIEENQSFSAKKKVFEIQKIDPLLFKAII